jgi:hypothetical protein
LANVERRRAGCGSLALNTRLRAAIRLHVAELGRHGNLYISHVSDDGRTFVDRAKAQGYHDPGGENVARGQRDAADVMDSWMNSSGHRGQHPQLRLQGDRRRRVPRCGRDAGLGPALRPFLNTSLRDLRVAVALCLFYGIRANPNSAERGSQAERAVFGRCVVASCVKPPATRTRC